MPIITSADPLIIMKHMLVPNESDAAIRDNIIPRSLVDSIANSNSDNNTKNMAIINIMKSFGASSIMQIEKGEFARRAEKGIISAIILNNILVYGNKGAAIKRIAGHDNEGWKMPNEKYLNEYWGEYKAVAHYWAASMAARRNHNNERYCEIYTSSDACSNHCEVEKVYLEGSDVIEHWMYIGMIFLNRIASLPRPKNAAAHIPWPPHKHDDAIIFMNDDVKEALIEDKEWPLQLVN